MAIAILTNRKYQRGFVLGQNGETFNEPKDVMDAQIPQLHALLLVLTDEELAWNDTVKKQLSLLASKLIENIHEAHEEIFYDRMAEMDEKNKAA